MLDDILMEVEMEIEQAPHAHWVIDSFIGSLLFGAAIASGPTVYAALLFAASVPFLLCARHAERYIKALETELTSEQLKSRFYLPQDSACLACRDKTQSCEIDRHTKPSTWWMHQAMTLRAKLERKEWLDSIKEPR